MVKKFKFLEKPWMHLVLTIASSMLSLLVLALSAGTIISVFQNSPDSAPGFLIWIFIFVGLMSIVTFFKNPTKLNLIRMIILFVTNIGIGITVLFAKNNPILFSITAGVYCVSIIASRVFNVIQKHNVRNIVLNVIIALLVVFLMIGITSIPIDTVPNIQTIILLECLTIAIVSFFDAASIAFSQLKFKVLFKIALSTYSLEILFGLLTLMVCFSLIFPMIEEGITNFGDGLWYCFAVVTTIGFGDFAATTIVGRVLTVILGIYGIVVVAVITSIIVNFYNEVSGNKVKESAKELKKDIAEKKKELRGKK